MENKHFYVNLKHLFVELFLTQINKRDLKYLPNF